MSSSVIPHALFGIQLGKEKHANTIEHLNKILDDYDDDGKAIDYLEDDEDGSFPPPKIQFIEDGLVSQLHCSGFSPPPRLYYAADDVQRETEGDSRDGDWILGFSPGKAITAAMRKRRAMAAFIERGATWHIWTHTSG